MLQQIFDPEADKYLDGPDVSLGNIDPSNLNPQDFYWHQMEAVGGDLGKAACTLESKEAAVRFICGVQEEVMEATPRNASLRRISDRVREKVARYLDSNDLEIEEDDPRLALWAEAIDYIAAKEIAAELDGSIEKVSAAKNYTKELLDQVKKEGMRRFSLAPEDIEELELMASGVSSKQRAENSGCEVDEVTNQRKSISNKLKAKSPIHAVRIALEEGLIDLANPVPEQPSVELIDKDVEILDLYSQGKFAKDIGAKQERSFKAIGTKIHTLVDRLSAKSRANLVYRSIEEGVLTIKQGKPFHINNALRQLEITESLLLSARGSVGEYIGNEEIYQSEESDLTETSNGTGAGDGRQRVRDEDIKDFPKDILRGIKTVNNEVLTLLSDAYKRTGTISTPRMTEAEIQELENASQGTRVEERTGNRGALVEFRAKIMRKLGVSSMPHAVATAVEKGILPVKWSRRNEVLGRPAPNQRILGIISLLSAGVQGPEIRDRMDFSPSVLTRDTNRAYEELSAHDRPSLVYASFEKGLLVPDTRHRPLHSMASFLETAERHMALAEGSLNGINSTELNRYLSGLTPKQIEELVQASEGATAKERAAEKNITEGGVDSLRLRAAEALGTKNLTHAVFTAIKKGVIDIELNKDTQVELPEELVLTLSMIAQGALHQEVAQRRKRARHTISARVVNIRRTLGAKTTPHAIKRAFEEEILPL